jgi:hypothetical protein
MRGIEQTRVVGHFGLLNFYERQRDRRVGRELEHYGVLLGRIRSDDAEL